MKQSFTFGGMTIVVQTAYLTPKIIEALSSGRYENAERSAINMHVANTDRVVDLGGGIGCTGVVAGRIVGGENLMIIEANGDLIPDIKTNLIANGVIGAQLINSAIVATRTTDHISFFKSKGFWAGSLQDGNAPDTQEIQVTALSLLDVVKQYEPSVIICDTEGIEVEIFHHRLPSHVRLIILELHPKLYDQDTIKLLFDRLSQMGFSYLPRGSRGAVICFGRKKTPSA